MHIVNKVLCNIFFCLEHLDIKVLNFAKSNGVTLLSFPPHCSHKLQPLDVSVFGPLKKLINASQGNWMRNNPGKTMTIYDLPGIMREAWPLAAVQKNIIKGFEVAGIFPFNPEVFTDADYAPSFVTDRPYDESTNPNQSSLTEESKDRPNDNLPSAHTDCEVLIPNNQDTLQKWLSDHELHTIPVTGDGHCLLRSFSLCFQSSNVGPILTIPFLCDKLLEEAHKHWLHYKRFAVEGQDVLTDIARYVRSREYNTDTGDLIIAMLCNAFKVHAKIYRCDNGKVSTIEQKPWQGDAITTIRLSLEGTGAGAHYNAVMSKSITSNQLQSTPAKLPYDCTQAGPSKSPEILAPLLKAPPRKKTRANNRKRKCAILTDSPEKNELERQQIEKEKRKRKPTAKQPVKRKKRKTLKRKAKSEENSSSEEDARCLICFDFYRESKENEEWIQCIVCKKWFHLTCVNCPPSGSFICKNCYSDDSD